MCIKIATIEPVYIFSIRFIRSYLITNVVIIQIPTEILSFIIIISWPLI